MSLKVNRVARTMVYVACAIAILLVLSGTASAQSMEVTYFDNNSLTTTGAPQAVVHIVNPGNGALCADVYVWRSDQELSECCSCPITPNGVLTFTVDYATNNPGDHTPGATAGSIDVIADSTASCTDSSASNPTPAGSLLVWATHVNLDSVTSGYDVTETEALTTSLSSGEQSEAASRCGFLQSNGSNAGLCNAICTEYSTDAKGKAKSTK